MRSTIFRTVAALAAIGAVTAAPAMAGTSKGPSTAVDPFVLPSHPNVDTKSLLTVGESVPRTDTADPLDTYRMVGIPDGMGAFPLSGGNMRFLMNHELGSTSGVTRRHGAKGAFVSDWTLDKATHAIEGGEDLIRPNVKFWDYPSQTLGSSPSTGGANPRVAGDTFIAQTREFNRFCSASLTAPGQLMNKATGNGYNGQLFWANEEAGNEARLFGVTAYGKAQQLPRTGLFSWENTVAAPSTDDTTALIGLEDGSAGQLWTYVGTKTNSGSPFDKAGLTNGTNYVWDVVNEAVSTDAQFRSTYGKGVAVPVDLAEVNWDQSGGKQNADAAAAGLTLNRIEDGEFDPNNPNDFYFLTTEGGGTAPNPSEPGFSRDGGGLWKLSFVDVNDPSQGATLTLLLDGTEAPYLSKPDNLGIDRQGNVLIQEDPGGNGHLARVVAYRISSGKRGVLATFDPALFSSVIPGNPLTTIDEESSGIIDVSAQLGRGWFLFDAQAHSTNADPELVQNGQILLMKVKSWNTIYTIG